MGFINEFQRHRAKAAAKGTLFDEGRSYNRRRK